jgi:hypothetical protein
MELTETVETMRLQELIAYSPARQVRLKLVQTQTVVSELVCYEPGRQCQSKSACWGASGAPGLRGCAIPSGISIVRLR